MSFITNNGRTPPGTTNNLHNLFLFLCFIVILQLLIELCLFCCMFAIQLFYLLGKSILNVLRVIK